MTIEQITAPKQPNLSCRIELTYKEVRAIFEVMMYFFNVYKRNELLDE